MDVLACFLWRRSGHLSSEVCPLHLQQRSSVAVRAAIDGCDRSSEIDLSGDEEDGQSGGGVLKAVW